MTNDRTESLLERIAVALERIANHAVPPLHVDGALAIERRNLDSDVNGDLTSLDAPETSSSILEPFLNSRGIQIKVRAVDDAADQVIDSLSLFLGDRYDAISNLLAKIKRAMQKGLPITESLKNRAQHDVSSICQFCTRLHEVAFFEQYQYLRSPTYLIKAKTTTLPKAQRFFGGQWLERFILQKIKSVYTQVSSEVNGRLAFEYLINPQIVLPNGDDFELDILAVIGKAIYWVEAKSGDYQQHVSKYSKFARSLGLDESHSMMVLTDVPENRCDALAALFSMAVCNLQTFEDKLLTIVRSDTAEQTVAPEPATASELNGES